MTEKVKVSREVAQELKQVKQPSVIIFKMAVSEPDEYKARFGDLTFDELIRALYIGCEIKQTPEEQFISWYKDFCPAIPGDAICLEVIHKTIDILGIKIKGINE